MNFLFFAPIPLAFRAFQSDPTGLAINLAAFGILMLAAWLTRALAGRTRAEVESLRRLFDTQPVRVLLDSQASEQELDKLQKSLEDKMK